MKTTITYLITAAVIAVSFECQTSDNDSRAADFLFIGTYHMDNPGRDVHNTKVDDIQTEKRQNEIKEVARLLERYRPTKIMVESDATTQDTLDARFFRACHESQSLSKNEVQQLGFRIACDLQLPGVIAVDWNELGPIKDEDSIDYMKAVERHHQQQQYQDHFALGEAMAQKDQSILQHGTVRDMLKRINSGEWLRANAEAYFRIAQLGTPDDPIGANWVQLWFGRNLRIFNNIVRNTKPGDRVLVIYGAGHGNYLRQLATDSGMYRVHDPLAWLRE
jgi:hypothetical protein